MNHFQSKRDKSLELKEYPWMLSFVIIPDDFLIGGAVIVAKDWALTTANCLHQVSNVHFGKTNLLFLSMKTSGFSFRCGRRVLEAEVRTGIKTVFITAKKLLPHKKFNVSTMDYNIALVQVTTSFMYNNELPILITSRQFHVCI